MSNEQIAEEIKKLNQKIDLLISQKQIKDEWVGATVITKRFDWDKHDLERARRNGSIKYKVKKEGRRKSYRYLLSSVIH